MLRHEYCKSLLTGVLLTTTIGCDSVAPPSTTALSPRSTFQPTPTSATPSITDLSTDPTPILKTLPHVAAVTRHGPTGKTAYRIIQIADWHHVPKEAFAADHRSFSELPLTNEEIDRRYQEHLADVEKMQEQEIEFLREFIRLQGIKRFFIEGLSGEDWEVFGERMTMVKTVGGQIAELAEQRDELLATGTAEEKLKSLSAGIAELENNIQLERLDIGAAGRLLMTGEIEFVSPLESQLVHEAANPFLPDRKMTFDPTKNEAREDAQTQILLNNGPFSVVILGGAHDLSDNLDRLSEGKAEYIRVELEAWKELWKQFREQDVVKGGE